MYFRGLKCSREFVGKSCKLDDAHVVDLGVAYPNFQLLIPCTGRQSTTTVRRHVTQDNINTAPFAALLQDLVFRTRSGGDQRNAECSLLL